jgi:hypothetical protein
MEEHYNFQSQTPKKIEVNPKRQRRTRTRSKKELIGRREKNIQKTKGGREGRK